MSGGAAPMIMQVWQEEAVLSHSSPLSITSLWQRGGQSMS